MEIIGDDKKLRALYSEAKRADHAATPGFTSVWHHAQARSLKPRRAFNLSFALVTALLVLTLGSLAAWSMFSSRRSNQREAVKNESAPAVETSPEKINEGVKSAQNNSPAPVATPVQRSIKLRVRRSTRMPDAQFTARNQTTSKAVTIDTWQSPTATLLSSQMDDLFKSVPQLNENATEMKSFLPGRSNDKEK